MAFIKTIEPQDATGELRSIYDQLLQQRGKIAEVHKAQSLYPESIMKHMDLYLQLMYGKSPLQRYQREMIATVVSKANQCDYCRTHHGIALNHFWKDEARLSLFYEDPKKADLSDTDLLLCDIARKLTLHPERALSGENVNQLKDAGFDDRTILDLTLITAYFNFVNRIVLQLGLPLDEEEANGYKFD